MSAVTAVAVVLGDSLRDKAKEYYTGVKGVYVGPGWSNINGYEKIGRVLGGTLSILWCAYRMVIWLALWIGVPFALIETVRAIVALFAWMRKG